ncbi:DUF438 domain-containing protein [Pseudothermotoga sp.]|nr:DUF438 domain-containing protein [Pseudothermotoga sp.]MCX7813561.1 DUF438 domain-containing protein [Pseudothermotoga sp.]MDW8140035.1 DUF438 domain-containing protein [Pseudothermotoga sp.]
MSEGLGKEQKKQAIKHIIKQLHAGMPLVEAKEKFEKEIGSITSYEIAQIEQELINEGVSPEEIKLFCNVHAMLFESVLSKNFKSVDHPAHPINFFKQENEYIKKLLEQIRASAWEKNKEKLKGLLEELKGIEVHYQRKEQVLFPYLEKHGFTGPSKVMWGKHNDIRTMLRKALEEFDRVDFEEYVQKYLNPLVEEVDGMIFKEENILFPTALELLKPEEWVSVLRESKDVGYVYIKLPESLEKLIEELEMNLVQTVSIDEENIVFDTGKLSLNELEAILNTLPIDITFVDSENKVKYFSKSKDRIFVRTKSVIGRDVRNCHPPQSVDKVMQIIEWFRKGEKDEVDFWINFKGKLVYIRYFAVRDRNGKYLGTLEVTQDITQIKKLEGEKRLADETYRPR